MHEAEVVRKKVLEAYDVLLQLGFDDDALQVARGKPSAERFAKAEPGGLPWRKNLIEVS